MGNSMDFTTLEDRIVMCPEVLQDGIGQVTSRVTCDSINAIKEITCNDFKVACPDSEKFFFRLVTPGEVYTLGIEDSDGNIIAAEGGLVPCPTITSWANSEGEISIKIVNDHFENTIGLS